MHLGIISKQSRIGEAISFFVCFMHNGQCCQLDLKMQFRYTYVALITYIVFFHLYKMYTLSYFPLITKLATLNSALYLAIVMFSNPSQMKLLFQEMEIIETVPLKFTLGLSKI